MFGRKGLLWRLLAVLVALTFVAAACGDDDDDDDTTGDTSEETTTTEGDAGGPEGDGTLKIGYLLPETGALEILGPPMTNGVKMAIEEINAAGGVLGKDVELVPADDGTDPDVANQAADRLLAEDVDFIVGAAASGVSLAVLDKITGAGIPMCSPSNTGVQFTTLEDDDLYFRTAPPDNLQSQVLADLVVDDGNESVVLMGRSDEYGEGFVRYLKLELEALGATVEDEIIFDHEAGNYQAEAQQLAEADADAVVMISFEEGAQVLTAAIAEGVGPDQLQWYGADGIQSSSFWKSVDVNDPTVVEGIRGTAPSAAPADGEATFRERFNAFAANVDPLYSGHAYDCTVLAALGAVAADSDAGGDIADQIVELTREGEKCSLVAECIEALEGDADLDYDGAAGPLDFVDAGEPGAGAYDTWEFDAKGAVTVEEESIQATQEEQAEE